MSNEFAVMSLKQSNQFIVSPYTLTAHKGWEERVCINAIVATVRKGVHYFIRTKRPRFV